MSDPEMTRCACCSGMFFPHEQAAHLKSAHGGKHLFWHDARPYTTDKPSMTVGELKRIVICTPIYHLYEDRDGEHIFHCDGVAVDLTRKPHFFSIPPATY